MRLIVIQDEAMVADVVCGEEAIYIGRAEDCRVRLSDPQVAERQAVILPQRQGWIVQQLEPACPLLVNAEPVSGTAGLKTGDELTLGAFKIRVYPEHVEEPFSRVNLGTSQEQLKKFVASRLPAGTRIRKYNEAVTLQPEHLARMGEVNVRLAACTQVEELMDVALQTLLTGFAARRAWIGVRRMTYGPMEYVEGRLLTGQATDQPEIAEALKPRVLDRLQFLMIPVLSRADRTSVLAGPLCGPQGALGMLYLDSGPTGRRFTDQDVDYFILVCTVIAAQLKAVLDHLAASRAAVVAGEVAVAHEIQARLTPRKLPQWPQLQFGAFREPGREHTGDIYDVVKLGNGMAAFMVAYTRTGGPLPSLLMAQAQSAFRSSAMHLDAPHAFLRTLNWLLYDGEKDHPLHVFAGVIEPPTGKMRFAVAGDTWAYIINSRGEARALKPQEPFPPLGLNRAQVYPMLPELLEPAETLVMFTPGVITARNQAGEIFGEDRFVNILCDGFGQLASTMLKEMLTDLRSFTEGGTQPDDITVLMAHYVGKGKS